MKSILLSLLLLIALTSCCCMPEDDYINTIPMTNNPQVVPQKNASFMPGMNY